MTILAFAAAAVFVAREADIECLNPPSRRIVASRPAKAKYFDGLTSAR